MYATEHKAFDELPDHALLCPVSTFFLRFDIHDEQDQTNNNNVLMMGDKSSPCFSRLYELPTSCFLRRTHDICCVAQKISFIFRVQFNDVRQCWSLTIASQMVSALMAVQCVTISFLLAMKNRALTEWGCPSSYIRTILRHRTDKCLITSRSIHLLNCFIVLVDDVVQS